MQRRSKSQKSIRLTTVCEFRSVPCRFNGIQHGGKKFFELWTPVDNLREGGSVDLYTALLCGSTISGKTLRVNRLVPSPCIA